MKWSRGAITLAISSSSGLYESDGISSGRNLYTGGDVNGDENTNIVARVRLPGGTDTLYSTVQLSNGDRTYQSPASYVFQSELPGTGAISVQLADLDNDGIKDLTAIANNLSVRTEVCHINHTH